MSIVKWRSSAVDPSKDSRSSHCCHVSEPGGCTSSVSPVRGVSTGKLRRLCTWPGVPSETPTISRSMREQWATGSSAPSAPAVIE